MMRLNPLDHPDAVATISSLPNQPLDATLAFRALIP